MPLDRIAVEAPQGDLSGGERVWVKPALEERTLASFALSSGSGDLSDEFTLDSVCC